MLFVLMAPGEAVKKQIGEKASIVEVVLNEGQSNSLI